MKRKREGKATAILPFFPFGLLTKRGEKGWLLQKGIRRSTFGCFCFRLYFFTVYFLSFLSFKEFNIHLPIGMGSPRRFRLV